MTHNICLICNYRVGSTTLIKKLARENKLSNRWELFGDRRGIYPEYEKIISYDNISYIEKCIKSLSARRSAFKLMGDQINWDTGVLERIAETTKFVYLYRRDFDSQARSWTAWLKSKNHGHHYGKLKQYDINVTQEYFDNQTKILKRNYEFFVKAYDMFPGNIMCLEEFENQRPYDREYNWTYTPELKVEYNMSTIEKLKKEHQNVN